MPLYEYQCPSCGTFEVIQKFSDAALTQCPTCQSAVEKLISASAFHLKGAGWYITDYARKGKTGGESKSTSESKPESKTESKPDSSSSTATPAAATTA